MVQRMQYTTLVLKSQKFSYIVYFILQALIVYKPWSHMEFMHVYNGMWRRPLWTKIYSVRNFMNTRVRNFYEYGNFCDYSRPVFLQLFVQITYCFCVDGMQSKKHSSNNTGPKVLENPIANDHKYCSRNSMEKCIAQMVASRFKLANKIVQAKCRHRQWSVGLMALLLMHWCSPKVVQEKVDPWWFWS